MTDSNILHALARVHVDDLAAALPLYCDLTGAAPRRFEFRGIRLAQVGAFLLIQGADEAARSRAATLAVRDIDVVVTAVIAAGGEVLEGPAPGPNGARLIARHPDGNTVEYIELA